MVVIIITIKEIINCVIVKFLLNIYRYRSDIRGNERNIERLTIERANERKAE